MLNVSDVQFDDQDQSAPPPQQKPLKLSDVQFEDEVAPTPKALPPIKMSDVQFENGPSKPAPTIAVGAPNRPVVNVQPDSFDVRKYLHRSKQTLTAVQPTAQPHAPNANQTLIDTLNNQSLTSGPTVSSITNKPVQSLVERAGGQQKFDAAKAHFAQQQQIRENAFQLALHATPDKRDDALRNLARLGPISTNEQQQLGVDSHYWQSLWRPAFAETQEMAAGVAHLAGMGGNPYAKALEKGLSDAAVENRIQANIHGERGHIGDITQTVGELLPQLALAKGIPAEGTIGKIASEAAFPAAGMLATTGRGGDAEAIIKSGLANALPIGGAKLFAGAPLLGRIGANVALNETIGGMAGVNDEHGILTNALMASVMSLHGEGRFNQNAPESKPSLNPRAPSQESSARADAATQAINSEDLQIAIAQHFAQPSAESIENIKAVGERIGLPPRDIWNIIDATSKFKDSLSTQGTGGSNETEVAAQTGLDATKQPTGVAAGTSGSTAGEVLQQGPSGDVTTSTTPTSPTSSKVSQINQVYGNFVSQGGRVSSENEMYFNVLRDGHIDLTTPLAIKNMRQNFPGWEEYAEPHASRFYAPEGWLPASLTDPGMDGAIRVDARNKANIEAMRNAHPDWSESVENDQHGHYIVFKPQGEPISGAWQSPRLTPESITEPPKSASEGGNAGNGQVQVGDTVTHTRPDIHGKQVIAIDANGNAIVQNPEVAGGISRVKPPSPPEPPPTAQSTTPPRDEFITGIKNAQVDAERAARGLPEIETTGRLSDPEAWDQAQQQQSTPQGRIDIRNQTQQWAETPRPLTKTENAALLHDRVTLHNEHADAMNNMETALKTADPVAIADAKAALLKVESDIATNELASKRSGTENALGLQSRQMMARQDYTLDRMVQRYNIANNGEGVPDDVRARLSQLTKERDAAVKALDDHLAKAKTDALDKTIEAIKRKEQFAVRKGERAQRRQALDVEFQQITKDFNSALTHTNIGIPVDALPALAKMVRNRVQAGVVTVEGLVDAIHETIKDQFDEGLSKDDVRNALGQIDLKSMMDEHDQAKIDQRKASLQKQIDEYNRRIAEKDFSPITKAGQKIDNPELNDLIKARDDLRQQYNDIKPSQPVTNAQRLDAAKKAAQRSIDEYQRRIDEKDFLRKQSGSTVSDPELDQLKAAQAKAKEEYQKLRDVDPQVIAQANAGKLKGAKTRLQNRQAELDRMAASGEFYKNPTTGKETLSKPRTPIALDKEALDLKAKVGQTTEELNKIIKQREYQNRDSLTKTLDTIAAARRFQVLGRPSTLLKLAAAASWRMITSPIEEVIGAGLGKLPIIRKVAADAPRQGGFSFKAEAEALRQIWDKGSRADIKQALKTGETSLDFAYGHSMGLPPELLGMMGRIHAAFKVIPKRAEFFRSFQKRAEAAAKSGLDIGDPTVQATIGAQAYLDANRAIFLQDNFINNSYTQAIHAMERSGDIGKIGATGMKVLMPIVKVPTNYIGEGIGEYGAGALKGGLRILYTGLKNLTPEQRDTVMRAFKKQGLGAAMLTVGYFAPKTLGVNAGGYYQQGEKRKSGAPNANEVSVGGVNIPHLVLHSPPIEAMQFGATLRNVEDAGKKVSGYGSNMTHAQKSNSVGLAPALGGALTQVPFLQEPARVKDAFTSDATGSAALGDFIKTTLIPPMVSELAEQLDRTKGKLNKRQPKGFGQAIESGIPYVRSHVKIPLKKRQ